jgi:hypothetical protein
LLKKYRLFLVCSSISVSEKNQTINLKVLYAPRIKLVDRSPNDIDERFSIINRALLSRSEKLPEDTLLTYFVYLYRVVTQEH